MNLEIITISVRKDSQPKNFLGKRIVIVNIEETMNEPVSSKRMRSMD